MNINEYVECLNQAYDINALSVEENLRMNYEV